jgi:hypothetical protein
MANTMIIEKKEDGIHGFKAFLRDWTCRPNTFWHQGMKQYSCPGVFETDSIPSVCEHGMHFCRRLQDIFNYYSTKPNKPRVAEVIAWGMVVEEGNKCSTNKLEIIREIPWDEVAARTNSGKDCSGACNAGNYNAGDFNTGDFNTGDYNSGDHNTGDNNTGDCNTGNLNTGDNNDGTRNTGGLNTGNFNTGNRNTGHSNTGHRNIGNWNTGNWNTGNRNTGDWNNTCFSSGCFCTEEPEMLMFNKPSGMTYSQWERHPARILLSCIPHRFVEWACAPEMSEKEKKENPTYETTGGYLKILNRRKLAQGWWDSLDDQDRSIILGLPNFDAEIFFQCTGIRVDEKQT